MTTHRPGIFQIGRVTDDGATVTISGWGVGLCAAKCTCHRDPAFPNHGLRLHEGDDGSLGLAKHRTCDCCEPWQAEELMAVVADLAEIQAAPEVSR
jgi:hypothetical protein